MQPEFLQSSPCDRTRSLPPPQLLLVEDDDDHAEIFIRSASRSQQLGITRARSLSDAIKHTNKLHPALVVLDLGLPESMGLDTVTLFRESCPDIPVVVLTAISDLELGQEALRMGAMDFLSKEDITSKLLDRSIRYAIERWSQKRRLEDSLADLQYFSSMAAHDLVSPLDTIQGITQLIELELANETVSPRVAENLELLKICSLRSIRLVRDLHKLSTLGRKAVERERISLQSLLDEVRFNLGNAIATTQGRVELASSAVLYGDTGLVSHVMQNLIGNALKYCRNGVAPVVKVSCSERDGRAVVCVEDNGEGINESDSTRIFLPFERLVSSGDKKGSGLGLSICKKIVDAHGGEIWLDSEVGAGTRFYFHLGG